MMFLLILHPGTFVSFSFIQLMFIHIIRVPLPQMCFPLVFQVISRSCFRFTPAAPTIVHSVLHTCSDWPVISIYTLRCLPSTIHARGSIQSTHLSGLRSPIRVLPNDQNHSKGSSVPAEIGQTSSGDSGGNSAAIDQVFSMFKEFLEKTIGR